MKKLLCIILTLTILVSIFSISATAIEPHNLVDYEQANINNQQFRAGGFTSNDENVIDSNNKYYFEVDSKQDASKLIEECDLNKKDIEISEDINGKVIIQANVNNDIAQDIQNSSLVDSVEKNYNVNGCVDSVDYDDLTQWYLDAMNVTLTENGSSENTIKVELLDSGVSYVSALENVHHIDLISDENYKSNILFNDNSGHATALAGLICAEAEDSSFYGVNSNVDLYDVKVLDTNLQAPISKIVEGIYWGIENEVDIINMSFGTSVNSEILHNAVKEAEKAGILLIAAVGNNSEDGVLYPAAYPEVLAVGSTDSNGDYVEEYANGADVEVYAPGTQIISTGAFDGYVSGCGTSLSTALVTGVASRLMEENGATADFVRELLKNTGKTVEGAEGTLVDLGCAFDNYNTMLENYNNSDILAEITNNSPTESYDVGGIVTGYWNSDVHRVLVRDATDNVDELNNNSYLRTNFLEIMKFAADQSDTFKKIYADDEDATEKISKYDGYRPNIGGLHGLGVYSVNLKAIWLFAEYLNQGYTRTEAYNKVIGIDVKDDIDYFKNNGVYSEEENTTSGQLIVVRKFLDWVQTFDENSYVTAAQKEAYKEYIEKYKVVRGYADSNIEKKYLVVGLALHMIGDIYAHRTLVPAYAFDNANFNETNYASGNSSDYASYLVKSHFPKEGTWETFYEEFGAGDRLQFTQLANRMKESVINDLEENGHTGAYLYEDNQDFCRERLIAALNCSNEFLSRISSTGTNTSNPLIIHEQENVNLKYYDSYMSYYQ